MKTFNSLIPEYATCIRDGVLNSETLVRDIVKGDIVHMNAGGVVPADIRIIDSKGFKVNVYTFFRVSGVWIAVRPSCICRR
jgi:sodium/potassium-transporting ATPase subunit alpha